MLVRTSPERGRDSTIVASEHAHLRPATATMTGELTRLAFVGQTTYFAACALSGRVGSIDACFVDFREGASTTTLLERLEAAAPDVVVVFKPEIIPRGLLAGLDATTVGYLTEPVPRRKDVEEHPDLRRRLDNLRSIDATNFDRVIMFDPDLRIPDELGFEPWRAMALPVADRYFREVTSSTFSRRAIFVGRSTEHRERVLTPAKHRFDLLHVAHGVGPDELDRMLGETDVGINVHNENYPNFENRVLLHLAAGNLLVSERLRPSFGLEAGLDYVELEGPAHLVWLLERLTTSPDLFRRIRLRGRAKAELHRASRVYPALLHDLRLDLEAFGSRRRGSRPFAAHRQKVPASAPT